MNTVDTEILSKIRKINNLQNFISDRTRSSMLALRHVEEELEKEQYDTPNGNELRSIIRCVSTVLSENIINAAKIESNARKIKEMIKRGFINE